MILTIQNQCSCQVLVKVSSAACARASLQVDAGRLIMQQRVGVCHQCMRPGIQTAWNFQLFQQPPLSHPSYWSMQAASVVAVLLAGLTRLGGNAYIAKRLIAMLAAHAPGRSALRTACSHWRAQATGLPDDADAAHAAALQWAISRLWQQGTCMLHTASSHSTYAGLSGPQSRVCGKL